METVLGDEESMIKRIRRRVHRRHYRENGIDRYVLERYFSPIYDGVKTVADLRERYRKFVENDSIWVSIESVRSIATDEQKSLHSLEATIRRVFATPKKRGKK